MKWRAMRRPAPIMGPEAKMVAIFAVFMVLAASLYVFIALHMEMQTKARTIERRVVETQAASTQLYHGVASHVAEAGNPDTPDPDLKALEKLVRAFRAMWPRLAAELEPLPETATPFERIREGFGLTDPPADVVAIWESADSALTMTDLFNAQASLCIDICLDKSLTQDQKVAIVDKVSALVLREVYPRLDGLRHAAAAWNDRSERATRRAVNIGFAALAFAALFALGGIMLPQARTLRRARALLERSNRQLENEVRAQTERLATTLERAEAGSKAKSRFLRTLSHEIRTPMNGIMGAVTLLETVDMDADGRRFVSMIRTSGENMTRYLESVIDMAEVSAGPVHLINTPVSVDVLISQIAAEFEPDLAARGVAFVCDVHPKNMPLVLADELRLRQIIRALLENASRYTRSGFVGVGLRMVPSDDKVEIEVEVSDSGPGIPPEDQAEIFSRFMRIDETGSNLGAGLGLAIIKALVDVMGGRIDVYSEVGAGSVFTVTLSAPAAPMARSAA